MNGTNEISVLAPPAEVDPCAHAAEPITDSIIVIRLLSAPRRTPRHRRPAVARHESARATSRTSHPQWHGGFAPSGPQNRPGCEAYSSARPTSHWSGTDDGDTHGNTSGRRDTRTRNRSAARPSHIARCG